MSLTKIDFFNGYFNLLEKEGVASVILHTYDHYPETIHSDVDYCVSDDDLPKILSFVYSHCKASGWRMVQIMQHEVKAFFCICVSEDDPSVYIELDVCSDYMREGKRLIESSEILKYRKHIEGKSFYTPSTGLEFCYGLWKSIAKRKQQDAMLEKLNAIYSENPSECESYLRLLCLNKKNENLRWESDQQEIYDCLVSEYKSKKLVSALARLKKSYRRVSQPTGLLLNLETQVDYDRLERDSVFQDSMKYCFRSVSELSHQKTKGKINIVKMVLKSTLVISVLSKSKFCMLRYLLNKLGAYLLIKRGGKNEVVIILDYLENRLVKRWNLLDQFGTEKN